MSLPAPETSSGALTPEALHATPNALAPHYSRFRVAGRLLLSGHSHQAWPDRAFEGQSEAWFDAAEFVDEKWERAFAKADRVRRGFASLLGDAPESIALGPSTHELVVKLLSALPLRERRRIVTTQGEFHSARRQLDRLAEEGFAVVKVPHAPAARIAERLVSATDASTALVVVSCVLFDDARIVPGLRAVLERCSDVGAELLVDAYHALNVVPWTLPAEGLEEAFVVGGGYKYCQLGEGNCFLRVPPGRTLRPVITGWFSEFEALTHRARAGEVPYGAGPARFAGATYDPTSNYRAASVFDFFDAHALRPELLRAVSQHQIHFLASAFDAVDLDERIVTRDRSIDLREVGGFLALRSPHAGELRKALHAAGVFTDHRGETLRLGPAPYVSDAQLAAAIEILASIVRKNFS